jgi:hypothetical protein
MMGFKHEACKPLLAVSSFFNFTERFRPRVIYRNRVPTTSTEVFQ